jgi:hypothetical protein
MRSPVSGLPQYPALQLCNRAVRFELNLEVENVLIGPAPDGEHTMRRNLRSQLAVVGIHLEFAFGIARALHRFADNDAFVHHQLAQVFAKLGRFTDLLGDDVTRSFKSFGGERDGPFLVDEGLCVRIERRAACLLLPEILRKRLKPFLTRDHRLGAPLGLVRKIEIFELTSIEHHFNLRLELGG